MAITLGKDCSVSIGGTIASARSVSFSASARTIDVEPFGSREAAVYSVGWDATVSVEFLDSDSISVRDSLISGGLVSVSGGAGGWSFDAVVTSVTESDPIDGVATYTAECKLTRSGLR